MIYVKIAFVTVFFLMGVGFLLGKGKFLLFRYNKMPEEERQKYDLRKMLRFVGYIALIGSVYLIVMFFSHNFLLVTVVQVAYAGVIIASIIFLSNNNHFRKS